MLFVVSKPITETEKAIKEIIDKINQYYPPYIAPYIAQSIEKCSSVITLHLNIRIPEYTPSGEPLPVELTEYLSPIPTRSTDIIIPGGRILILTEPITSEIPKIDGKIQIFKNGIDQIATLQLSKISVKTPNRKSFSKPIKFRPWDILSINFVPKKPNKSSKTIIERATITALLIHLANLPFQYITGITELILT